MTAKTHLFRFGSSLENSWVQTSPAAPPLPQLTGKPTPAAAVARQPHQNTNILQDVTKVQLFVNDVIILALCGVLLVDFSCVNISVSAELYKFTAVIIFYFALKCNIFSFYSVMLRCRNSPPDDVTDHGWHLQCLRTISRGRHLHSILSDDKV